MFNSSIRPSAPGRRGAVEVVPRVEPPGFSAVPIVPDLCSHGGVFGNPLPAAAAHDSPSPVFQEQGPDLNVFSRIHLPPLLPPLRAARCKVWCRDLPAKVTLVLSAPSMDAAERPASARTYVEICVELTINSLNLPGCSLLSSVVRHQAVRGRVRSKIQHIEIQRRSSPRKRQMTGYRHVATCKCVVVVTFLTLSSPLLSSICRHAQKSDCGSTLNAAV